MILLFAYSKDAFADFHFMKQRKMQIPKSGSLLSLAILPNARLRNVGEFETLPFRFTT